VRRLIFVKSFQVKNHSSGREKMPCGMIIDANDLRNAKYLVKMNTFGIEA
jgi:hypothetical protein